MLKAVALSEIESRQGGDQCAEPASLAINIPNVESQQEFLDDLDDRLKTLE